MTINTLAELLPPAAANYGDYITIVAAGVGQRNLFYCPTDI